MKLKRAASLILITLIIGLGFRDANTHTAAAAAPCLVGQQAAAIGFWTWAANASVKVYIVAADFKAEEIPYLLTALDNWNSVSETTGSRVKLEYRGSTTQELSCANCLTVKRGKVFDKSKRHATSLTAYSAGHDQIITYATIAIDPVLTNRQALLDAFAHELGHNFGLLDCFTCKKKSTLMNQFKVINEPNNMAAPTPCDIAQVSEAYKELKVRVRPSPTFIDQGEEPEDDDTPVIIPNPHR
jgi:hypothetical protein